jgi:hypothetical protein
VCELHSHMKRCCAHVVWVLYSNQTPNKKEEHEVTHKHDTRKIKYHIYIYMNVVLCVELFVNIFVLRT